MNDEMGRTPPYHLTAEAAVVGSVIEGGKRVLDELEDAGFDPGDFYVPKHETVFRAAMACAAAGEPVELPSIAAKLGPDLPAIGGPGFLLDTWRACVTTASVGYYARIVHEHAVHRRLIAAGTKIVQIGYAQDGGALEDIVDAAQSEVAAISEIVHGKSRSEDEMSAALDDMLERIEKGGSPSVPTGIVDVDRLFLGGLPAGTLTTVAARPGVGKTAFGVQMALNMTVTGRGIVGYTSLEMSRQDLLMRAVASLEKVEYSRILRSPNVQLTDAEARAVRRGTERMRDSGLLVSRRTRATAAAIKADIRSAIRRYGSCSAWFVDYLGLVTPADQKVIREQQIAGITRALKQTGLETGVPIVLLSQLNREGEKAGRPPVITDLRESGAIEQDSDNVVLLHRDQEKDPGVLGVRVAKNRRGALGDFALTFEGEYQRVTERDWKASGPGRGVKAVP